MSSPTTGPSQPSALDILTQNISKSVLGAVNEKLKATHESMLDDVRELLNDSTPDITERATKKLKIDNPELNSPGNRDQYAHNTEVLRTIEKAANAVLKGDREASLKNLSEGKRIITHRQKLVRLADREEKGWRFIKEYQKDNLAEDSDDEKAIARARRAANSKGPSSSKPSFRQPQQSGQSNRTSQPYRQPTSTNRFRGNQSSSNQPQQNQQGTRPQGPRVDFRRDRYDRECWVCNQRGHLSFDCTQR